MNKENYERICKMISDGEDIEKINEEFEVARVAMDSMDDEICNKKDQIPYPFRVAWDAAYEEISTTLKCRPETQLRGLKWCLEVIEYLESKKYI